jgi:hypothetical protein
VCETRQSVSPICNQGLKKVEYECGPSGVTTEHSSGWGYSGEGCGLFLNGRLPLPYNIKPLKWSELPVNPCIAGIT